MVVKCGIYLTSSNVAKDVYGFTFACISICSRSNFCKYVWTYDILTILEFVVEIDFCTFSTAENCFNKRNSFSFLEVNA